MQLSWRSSRAVSSAAPRTIAEGLAVQDPFPEAVANLRDFVDDIVLVEDEVLISSMRLAHQELGVALEPSGAAGLAALLAYPGRFRRTRVATVLTGGGSLTAAQMQQFLKPLGS